jgi:uncharacterized membrane protein YraQ (UPF0718 family)
VNISKPYRWPLTATVLFGGFVLVSALTGFEPGQASGRQFMVFMRHMLALLPCIFILIGLFDVWVKRATVERHLGHGAGLRSYFWAVLIAGTSVGGFHVVLPAADALRQKGARLGVVMAYLSCAAVCRIPMTLFEASFLGWRFTAVRFAVSLPLILLTSALLGRLFGAKG